MSVFRPASLLSTGPAMIFLVVMVAISVVPLATAFHSSHQQDGLLSDTAYLRGLMSHLMSDKMMGDEGYLDYPMPSYDDLMMNPAAGAAGLDQPDNLMMMKEYEDNLSESMPPRDRLALSLRDQEYLKHSSLFSGSSAAGQQDDVAAPEAEAEADQPAKTSSTTDNVLPAYCNPPNPCPIGYTSEDGCLEEFENTAAFSREYQAAQDCMCDTEHMFDCPASMGGKNGNAKNRATANMVDTALRKIMSDLQGEHKSLVSKKFLADKYYDELSGLKERAKKAAQAAGTVPLPAKENPYLQGDKLPIAAKKGNLAA